MDSRTDAIVPAPIACDVAIVGAGPAGCATAAYLARQHDVVLLDRAPCGGARIGESLPPAANRLLADLGVSHERLARAHRPCHGNRSDWGAGGAAESNFLRDPHGPGWHLDRAAFDSLLRDIAGHAGARLLPGSRLRRVARHGASWQLQIDDDAENRDAGAARAPRTLHARCVVDATGRAASVARQLGVRRYRSGRLVCHWLHGSVRGDGPHPGLTQIAAAPDGWWYTAPLPGERRVLALHTDADLAPPPRDADALLAAAAPLPEIGATLGACEFAPLAAVHTTAAGSAWCGSVAGPGWLVVGDAALSFDPIAAQGMFNALYTALAGAYSIDRHLAGARDALDEYTAAIDRIRDVYFRTLRGVYAEETRWSEREFWRRRAH